jgi:hypothetical protein
VLSSKLQQQLALKSTDSLNGIISSSGDGEILPIPPKPVAIVASLPLPVPLSEVDTTADELLLRKYQDLEKKYKMVIKLILFVVYIIAKKLTLIIILRILLLF